MAKQRPTVGTDGRPLPILPPERDARVWARLVRVMFYTPGFLALLLLKTGEPTGFGIMVEAGGADSASRTGVWSGALVLELLSAVPFLCAVPPLFHELASSTLLHARAPGAADVALGASEFLPAMAVLPFMLYQLAGFGTLHFIVSRPLNWAINIGILVLIVGGYVANRHGAFDIEKLLVGFLVLGMGAFVFHGVLQLRRMQTDYDLRAPHKAEK